MPKFLRCSVCGKEISESEFRENNGICSDCLLILEIDEEDY